jgi:hypothetical protein
MSNQNKLNLIKLLSREIMEIKEAILICKIHIFQKKKKKNRLVEPLYKINLQTLNKVELETKDNKNNSNNLFKE